MKKLLGLLFVTAGLAFAGLCANAGANYMPAYAEGETTSSEPVAGTTSEEIAPVEPEESWFKKQYNTFVVPLIAGGTGITLLAGLISVGVTFAKNKKLDKKILLIESKAQEKYNKAEEKLLQINDILMKINEIYETSIKSGKLNEEAKEIVANKLNEISKLADETVKKVCKVDDLIKVQALLVELETKVAEQSREVVKSGIIQDIEEIRKLVKNI